MKREISKSSQSPVSQSAPGPVSCGAGQQVKIFLDTLIPHQDIGSSANVQVMCCAVVVSTFLPDQRPVPSLSQVLCGVFSCSVLDIPGTATPPPPAQTLGSQQKSSHEILTKPRFS